MGAEVMPVQCPFCQHTLSLKGAKPGRYSTACPKCQGSLRLTIPDDPAETPAVKAVKAVEPERARVASAPEPQTPTAGPVLPGPIFPASVPPAGAAVGPIPAAPAPSPTAGVVALPAGSAVGAYRVVRELGRGGMGVVYLARRFKPGPEIALKVMKPEWARDAAFVARITREAYAAAQLVHPNLVPIIDFGRDRRSTYFGTGYVEGASLAGLLRQRGRLEPEEAVGSVLQAARGLKFAHDQSMVHRDVKPDNLLMDQLGLVRVADLGLTKTPGLAEAEEKDAATAAAGGGRASTGGVAPVTGPAPVSTAHAETGDPAFMAPEQAVDPARIDPRADIYALGCTLYALLTGRPPLEGGSVVEVLDRHQNEPVPSPDSVVKGLPRELSAVVLKMTAKQPADRYRDLGEVIRDLEAVQALTGGGPLALSAEQARAFEEAAREFHASPSAKIRSRVVPGFVAVCGVLALLCALTRKPVSAGAFLGLGLMTAAADFVVRGLKRRTPLFLKAGGLAALTPPNEWLVVAAGVAVGLAALWVFHLFWVWVVLAAVAVGIAVGLHLVFDGKIDAERREALGRAEGLLRSLRRSGPDEDALRRFVCEALGDRWEELYEVLFGYDARLEARRRWGRGDRARGRPRFAAWRDPVAAWLDARTRARRTARERTTLAAFEERGLVAVGVNEMTARRRSRRAAEAMVVLAAEIREAVNRRDDTIPVNRAVARSIRDAATQPEKVLADHEPGLLDEGRFRPADLLAAAVGPKARFLAGAALLAGCLLWMRQNEMLHARQAEAVLAAATKGAEAVAKGDTDALGAEAKALADRAAEEARAARARGARNTERLRLPLLPAPLAALLSSFGAGAGGILLILSSFFRGSRMALFAVPAAAVPLLGPKLGLPPIGTLDPSFAPSVVGAAVFAAGVLFGRSRR